MSSLSLSAGNVLAEQLTKKQRMTNEKSSLSPAWIDNDVGGPIEDTETAVQKMKDAGFDIEKDINTDEKCIFRFYGPFPAKVTPMIYFCYKGDLKMCRYLFVNGATCTRTTNCGFWFPMYAAAYRSSNLHVCKWLYEHGAKEDIRKRNNKNRSPLQSACTLNAVNGTIDVIRWLLLHGAASGCRDDSTGQIDEAILRHDLLPFIRNSTAERPAFGTDKRPAELLLWAEEELKTHTHFLQFLYCAKQIQQQVFAGNSGILQYIADCVGVVRGKDLRTIRQLADLLQVFIQEGGTPVNKKKD